jgi:hypothetical protein
MIGQRQVVPFTPLSLFPAHIALTGWMSPKDGLDTMAKNPATTGTQTPYSQLLVLQYFSSTAIINVLQKQPFLFSGLEGNCEQMRI